MVGWHNMHNKYQTMEIIMSSELVFLKCKHVMKVYIKG